RIGKFSREHFGFADGLSQPIPYDAKGAVLIDGKPSVAPDDAQKMQRVPLGEFLLGYVNGHSEVPPGPVVGHGHAATHANLQPSKEAAGFFDVGANGSYLVVRELRQDVAAFWQSMEKNVATLQAGEPQNKGAITSEWLAERCFGRDRNGHLLCP